MQHFIGVDVGTGSARAGVFDESGTMLAAARHPIAIFHEGNGHVEQSSRNIWDAVCIAVRGSVAEAGLQPQSIVGLGFDATCSLVLVGAEGELVPVGDPQQPDHDIIVWMDHRAVAQAERINATNHPVLRYVGGRISPEMQTPKLLWLREYRPHAYERAAHFFDLADYLGWRATGSLVRSACTVTCKWTYLAHEARWDASYFEQIGLADLAADGFRRIGADVTAPGTRIGGLTAKAAAELGLPFGLSVAAGLIDAHAGGVGTVGAIGQPSENLAYVFGTSSCTMTTTRGPAFIPGVWGPYFGAMIDGAWLNEGGQSAAGAAIDRLLGLHPASVATAETARATGQSLPIYLARRAEALAGGRSEALSLAAGLHVVPEFLGNRAPFADPHARAAILGLGMETDEASLVALYIAGLSGIACGLRQIIETQAQHGATVQRIVISGGAGEDALACQLIADTCGLPVIQTAAAEPVLLGSAMLGAVAAGALPTISDAMSRMSGIRSEFVPKPGSAEHASIRYKLFNQLQDLTRRARTA